VIANINGKVLYLGETVEGKRHDKKLADDDSPPFPLNSRVGGDTGYQGYSPPGISVITPLKKPKGGVLEADEKESNHRLSSQRVIVENSIGGIKINRIVHDIFRNRKTGFSDQSMSVSTGLHNFRRQNRSIKNIKSVA
jgi:hypothetical protein